MERWRSEMNLNNVIYYDPGQQMNENKKACVGPGGMAQQVRALTALAEDLSSVSAPHQAGCLQLPVALASRNLMPSFSLCIPFIPASQQYI